MNYSRISWPDWFSLEVPENWEFAESSESISLYRPDGVGAFTISLITTESFDAATAARVLVQRFAKQRGWIEAPQCVAKGDNASCVIRNDEGDDYWVVVAHALAGASKAVLISYTVDRHDEQSERSDRDRILESFRWEKARTNQ